MPELICYPEVNDCFETGGDWSLNVLGSDACIPEAPEIIKTQFFYLSRKYPKFKQAQILSLSGTLINI